MCIFEYDEAKEKELIRKAEFEDGVETGIKQCQTQIKEAEDRAKEAEDRARENEAKVEVLLQRINELEQKLK